jgi:hypothetical protein
MRPSRVLIKLLVLSLIIATGSAQVGCVFRKTKLGNLALDLLEEMPMTHEIAAKFDKYDRIAMDLKKFHDSGEFIEDDVLDILKTAGVIGGSPKRAPTPSAEHAGSRVPPPVTQYGGGYRWPLDAGVVSSEYGARWGKVHKGLDIAADLGEPVKASAAGIVIYAGDGMRGYGNALILRHDIRITTLYGHNQKLLVKSGDHVNLGQTIAHLGSTGHSTGPHVHFEIRDGDTPLPPRQKLMRSRF